ncbi:MAG: sigma-70 family RNA polymerase sigma factor, partial [Turicibacter sp.]
MKSENILTRVRPFLNQKNELDHKHLTDIGKLLNVTNQDELSKLLHANGIKIIYVTTEKNESKERSSGPIEKANARLREFYEPKDLGELKLQTNELLCVKYQAGEELALHYLIENNEKLVYSRVMRYVRKFNHRLEIEDLYSYGVQGIIDAAKKFDTSLENKFTTYSTFWIDQRILRAICDYGFTIRVPVHVFDSLGYILRCQFIHDFTTEAELIHHVMESKGWSKEKVQSILKLKDHTLSPTSLNTVVGEDSDMELIDFVMDDHIESPVTHMENWMLKNELEQVLETLTEREQMVLKLRFGLVDGEVRTLEEIGSTFGLTRERIRQIESKALRKLRHPSRSRRLMPFGDFEIPNFPNPEDDE